MLSWGFKPAHVPWVNQCFQTGSQALNNTMIDLVLTYARTTCQLTGLVEHDNTALMTELVGMQQLYCQSREVGVDPSEFDPVVDNKLFMRKATPVMHSIFANKDIFEKVFIAFFPQDECNISSCFCHECWRHQIQKPHGFWFCALLSQEGEARQWL